MSQPQNFTPTPSPAPSAPRTAGRLAIAQVPVSSSDRGRRLTPARGSTGPRASQSRAFNQVPRRQANSNGSIRDLNAANEAPNDVGWGAGVQVAPGVPVIDPTLNWLEESNRSPSPEHFFGAIADEDNEDPAHQTQSDEEPLPDAQTFDWGANPPAEAQHNLPAVGAGLIGELQGQLHFSESNLQLVNQLFQATDEEKWRLTVMFFVHLLGKTTSEHMDTPTLPGRATSAKKFTFSNHVKCCMRNMLRQILTKGNVESYTRTMTLADSTPIRRTPLLMLKAHIRSQPSAFHQDYLPPGYPNDIDACAAVIQLMRGLLKNEKGLLRNLLLTNIKEFNHRPIDGAVPSLDALVVIIDQNMAARKQLKAEAEILRSYDTSMTTRLGFLRLYTVVHHVHRDPTENISQWELIDQQLEHVRSQSKLYRIAYGRVVRAIDKELFGQKKKFDVILEHEHIRLPTEEDVEKEIHLMTVGGQGQGPTEPFV
ncbi:hypothetical protein PGT21_000554 [Puccinia graminis f. sp. tritici]|uniref:Uncharacterized protein n=1 Tax=Puccinia graminis f. sp. tritici TaxID=56615 RepID=A0A5B0P319_PUCGR|nr:hypothetical protein PGT21_000554 [Puccinia graminis f. sp. tritici]